MEFALEGSSKSEKTTERKTVSYWALFRYATPLDHLLMFISVIACAVKAIVYPAGIVIYSEMVSMLVDRHLGVGTSSPTLALPLFGGGRMLTNATYEESMVALREDSWASGIWMGILAIVLFVSGIIHVDILNWTGLRITIQLRKRFFQATIRKDVGWHDITANQNFAVRITDNIEKVRDGISEKLGHFVNVAAGGIFIIILSFIYGWKLTLVIIVYIPIMLFCNYIVAKYNSKLTIREQDSYVNAGSLVEEVIGGVRTVVAFGGEKSEMDRYDQLLVPALNASKRKGAFSGVAETLTRAMPFITAAATFWYGISLLLEDRYNDDKDYTPAVLMIVFFGTLISADHIARCAPYFDAFTAAVGSIVPIYEVIDSPTKIDPLSTDGKILNNGLKGDLEFQDVFFTYPSRDDATVLRGLSITIKAGETVALVGHSGCGKSTCLQLIQRFYDPMFGNILADGLDVRKYNVSWLRSNMAVVGQEPVLFQGTIGENIRHGKPNATQKEAEDAARAAGAHDFIINLPESYDTFLSEKGLQLSGGQKQRIAIARALIHNPKILLLDEATSALDYQSEKLVQNALNAASKGRTTIVVSHRLSAIKDADRIIFIHEGKAIEEGAHNELMQLRGKYYEMITSHGQDESDTNEKEDPKKEHILESPVDHENNVLEKNFLKNNSYQEFTMTTKKDDEKKKKDDGEETQFFKAFIKILKIARQEWCYLAIGTICAILYGCTQPAFAFIIGEFYAALAQPEEDVVRQRVSILAIISLIVGIIVGTVCYTQTYFFNIAGVWLTTKIRSAMFKAILSQEIGWFDEKENSIGSLSARLSGDAASVQGAIGYPLSGIIQALANLFCCITMAFYFSWQIALACLCTAPIMVGSIVLEAKFMARSAILEKRILEETSSLATEAISNIRTVAALRREEQLIVDYNKEVDRYGSQLMKRQRFRGVVNSSGWSLMYLGYAVSLTYGGILCSEGKIEFQNIIKVTESLLYGLMILAMALAFLPTFTSALISGHRLFRIIERKPKIGPPSHYDNKSMVETSSKAVLYDNVSFRYPTRPDVQVLGGLNLKVLQGKTVALVGSSGCGKSTCIQLLLRYYDPEAGHITLDGEDIQRDLPLVTLRRRLGIVSQEPVLFERTIAENIAYGDNSRTVPMDEIIEAAKMANAYSFVTALPSGFETKLGARGTQLSGGQKQRIAIARALVRNPQILLLDEATSALDLQSERVVQSALDSACSGRTCIIVAHRLSTIQNADIICVLQNGRIVERGNHSQLIAKDGIYARLYKSQPVG